MREMLCQVINEVANENRWQLIRLEEDRRERKKERKKERKNERKKERKKERKEHNNTLFLCLACFSVF